MSDILRGYAEPFLFLLFLSGELLLLRQELQNLLLRIQMRFRMEQRKQNIRPRGTVYQHIDGLLGMLPGTGPGARTFLGICFAAGMAAALAAIPFAGMGTGMIAGISASAVPYLILRIRCGNIRNDIRNEGETLVSALLSAYRINHCNIESAMAAAASQKDELPGTASYLSSLLLRLRECRSAEEIRAVTDQFAQAVDSDWARLLAVNIREAFLYGTDIQLAMEELLKQMREARILSEERLRENNETLWMTVFMIPGSLGAVVALSVGQMGISITKLAESQFGDSTASSMFILIVILFGVNLLAGQLVRRRRTDL